jgi:hypothetical protein
LSLILRAQWRATFVFLLLLTVGTGDWLATQQKRSPALAGEGAFTQGQSFWNLEICFPITVD